MRDYFYAELGTVCSKLFLSKEAEAELIACAEELYVLMNLARQEGLLAMEERVAEYTDSFWNIYLRDLVMLVVDGTDPEQIEDYGMLTYATSQFSELEKWKYLMLLYGVMQIQVMCHPMVFERFLIALLSPGARKQFLEGIEQQKTANTPSKEEQLNARIEMLCNEDEFPDRDSFMDLCFMKLDSSCTGMPRLLREISVDDLAMAMKDMPGKVRRVFLQNMSRQMQELVVTEMNYLGPVRGKDVEMATERIFAVLQKLEDRAEVILRP